MSTPSLDSDAVHMTDVYAWRQEQEAALRASKGMGMTDEEVIRFVDDCTLFQLFPSFRTEEYSGVK